VASIILPDGRRVAAPGLEKLLARIAVENKKAGAATPAGGDNPQNQKGNKIP